MDNMDVLVATGRVFDKIADSTATHELDEIIADGAFYGMQSFDQSLLSLFASGISFPMVQKPWNWPG